MNINNNLLQEKKRARIKLEKQPKQKKQNRIKKPICPNGPEVYSQKSVALVLHQEKVCSFIFFFKTVSSYAAQLDSAPASPVLRLQEHTMIFIF